MRWRSRLQGKQRSARRRQDERTHAWKSPKVWTAFMVQTTLAEPGGKSWPKHISIGPQEADGKVRPARLIIQGKQAPKTVEFNQRKSRLICISLCTSQTQENRAPHPAFLQSNTSPRQIRPI